MHTYVHHSMIYNSSLLSSLQTGAWWTGVNEKKEGKGERERAVSLGLCVKQ